MTKPGISPFGFAARITGVYGFQRGHKDTDTWILGLPKPDAEYQTVLPWFTGQEAELQTWFTQTLSLQEFDPVPWLAANGTFRKGDWRKASDPSLPGPAAARIKKLGLPADAPFYVLDESQFRRELMLLHGLAQLAGALPEKQWARAKEITLHAEVMLDDLWADEGHVLKIRKGVQAKERSLVTSKEIKEAANGLLTIAIMRGLTAEVHATADTDRGTLLVLEVQDVLSFLYAVLFANLGKGWKKCKRADCPNIFLIEKRKEYHVQYCAHLESLRRIRKELRETKTKGGKKK